MEHESKVWVLRPTGETQPEVQGQDVWDLYVGPFETHLFLVPSVSPATAGSYLGCQACPSCRWIFTKTVVCDT